MIKAWLEATRPRTLPVSVAGVLAGCIVAATASRFAWPQALICLLFALGAQITSNFANEYYDFRRGADTKGRVGFRRGVTEGDITPRAMKRATYGLLAVTCLLGCSLIIWGGWWLIAVGAVIAIFALAYSAGPWPLSYHGLGDVAVIIFFGLVPVLFTSWLQAGDWSVPCGHSGLPLWAEATCVGLACGMLAANVLIVNNYRDMDTDRAVGKRTTVVIFGRPVMSALYLFFDIDAILLLGYVTWSGTSPRWWAWIGPGVWALVFLRAISLWRRLRSSDGAALNPLLGDTARFMLLCIAVLALLSVSGGFMAVTVALLFPRGA